MNEPLQQRALNWERHWASGARHSCASSYGELYGGAIGAFWRGVFSRLPAGARVLDLATGSGAIPSLLLASQSHLVASIDAVDIVQTPPPWFQSIAREASPSVRFHGGVDLESLPFRGETFDLVTSQYGIEYADLKTALGAACAVVAKGGRFAAVMHHRDSTPVRLAVIEIDHIDWLVSDEGLLATARAMIEPLNLARTPEGRATLAHDPVANQARDRFNVLQDELHARQQRVPVGADVLGEAQDTIAQVVQVTLTEGTASATAAWEGLRDALLASRQRLVELVDCALDEPSAQAARRCIDTAGLNHVEVAELRDGEHLMGWSMQGTRAAG
jgi:SAM-dependent methyltransferase